MATPPTPSVPSTFAPSSSSTGGVMLKAVMAQLEHMDARLDTLTTELYQVNTCVSRISRWQACMGGFTTSPSPSPSPQASEDEDDDDGSSDDDDDEHEDASSFEDEDASSFGDEEMTASKWLTLLFMGLGWFFIWFFVDFGFDFCCNQVNANPSIEYSQVIISWLVWSWSTRSDWH